MSRDAVNALHRSLGGVVGNDLLPENGEARRIFEQAGFTLVEITNAVDGYILTGYRPAAP